jgi:adenylyltransferase/sulfurtransferase
MYLAAAGIGKIGLLDFDTVDFSNLQRQIIHSTADVGKAKTESAKETIQGINPGTQVVLHNTRITSENALEIIGQYDIVVDGTDNFPTRYLTNDACVLLRKPNVYGSIFRFEGQASVFAPHLGGPCYRCLYPEPPPPGMVPSCAEGGVLGVLPGMIGTIQANEAIKVLVGIGEPLIGRLMLVDALSGATRTITIRRDPECPACGTRRIRELIDYDQFCGVKPEPVTEIPDAEITPKELAARIAGGTAPLLIDVREPHEWAIAKIPGARLIPLAQLERSARSLDPSVETVIHCHTGVRSQWAAGLLREMGFSRVRNLTGGIKRWSEEVDPSVPQY